MRASDPLFLPRPGPPVDLAAVARIPAILWLGAALVAAVPAAAASGKADDALTRHLERLQQQQPAAAAADPARRLRHLRFLRHLSREDGGGDFLERLDAVELRVRTGERRTPPTPAAASASADKQGAIGGTVVRSSSAAPLAGVSVWLWDADGLLVDITDTGPAGSYGFDFLDDGLYFASTQNFDGFIDELYDDILCPGGGLVGCDPTTGDAIEIVDQGSVQVDFALALGGSIRGTVTAAASGEPLAAIGVQLWNASGDLVVDSFTDDQGRYRIDGLEMGTYFLTTESFGEYLDELYDDIPCPGGGFLGCDPTTGDGVTVAVETTTAGIDFALDQLGSIGGRVSDELSGDPIPFASLTAVDALGSFAGSAFSDELGEYRIGGLEAGTYFVTSSNTWGFDDELYDDLPCPLGSCDATAGTEITVSLGATTTVDFILGGGCVDSDTVLCLNGGRFRVESSWRDFEGETGDGVAVKLTRDTGYFWFFADTNVEQVVKVLDACNLPGFNTYWVFASGLTNLEVILTVTDVESRQSRRYDNPLGSPLQPIQDTGAFATCP